MASVQYSAVQETAARLRCSASDEDAASRRGSKRTWPAYLFILPGMLLFVVWTFYPLLNSFIMSFRPVEPDQAERLRRPRITTLAPWAIRSSGARSATPSSTQW